MSIGEIDYYQQEFVQSQRHQEVQQSKIISLSHWGLFIVEDYTYRPLTYAEAAYSI